MNTIFIEIDLSSVDSLKNGIEKLTESVFTDYKTIHALVKKDNKALDIDLRFVIANNDEKHFLQPNEEQTKLWEEITSVLPKKYKERYSEQSLAELVLFSQASQHDELTPYVVKWINRIATYNYGIYSKTLCYPDSAPLGLWTAFFFMKTQNIFATLCSNFFGSLNLLNLQKRKSYDDSTIDGFKHPLIVAALNHIYKSDNWNNEITKVLAAQISHLVYYDVPDSFLDHLKQHNPYDYLLNEANQEQFIQDYIKEQRAVYKSSIATGASEVISDILPIFIDDRIIEKQHEEILQAIEA